MMAIKDPTSRSSYYPDIVVFLVLIPFISLSN